MHTGLRVLAVKGRVGGTGEQGADGLVHAERERAVHVKGVPRPGRSRMRAARCLGSVRTGESRLTRDLAHPLGHDRADDELRGDGVEVCQEGVPVRTRPGTRLVASDGLAHAAHSSSWTASVMLISPEPVA